MAVPGRRKAPNKFSSTIFKSMEEDNKVFCVPCDKSGSQLSAYGYCTVCHEHMCEPCFKHHKRSFLSRCHTLLDKGRMPQTQQLRSTSANTGQSDEPTNHHSVKTHSKLFPVLTHSALESPPPAKKRSRTPTSLKKSTQPANKRSKPPPVLKQSPPPTLKKLTPTVLKQSSIVVSKSGDPSQHAEICVKKSQDRKTCWVTGMVFITPDRLILTDFNNRSIKMVDTSSRSITARLKLSSVPWDITSVTDDELVVTLPGDQTLQFISASSNKLTMKHTLKVDGSCNGISCCQGKLVVTYQRPAKLQILDRTGRVQTTVTTSHGGEHIFAVPYYVTANNSSIYVSDWVKRAVIRLNWQGEVIGRHVGFGSTHEDSGTYKGLALSAKESVVVCEYTTCKIREISGDCTEGKVALEELNKPFALCWSDEEHKLYVSSFTMQEKHDNFLQVFKM